jgi:hypothetical protein
MFDKLIAFYKEYKEARERKSYDADLVQALGLRFCGEWKACKDALIEHFKLEEDEFDYSLHHTLMPKLVEAV